MSHYPCKILNCFMEIPFVCTIKQNLFDRINVPSVQLFKVMLDAPPLGHILEDGHCNRILFYCHVSHVILTQANYERTSDESPGEGYHLINMVNRIINLFQNQCAKPSFITYVLALCPYMKDVSVSQLNCKISVLHSKIPRRIRKKE